MINEQVLANGLEVGLLTRGPVPWGLSQALVLSPGSGQFKSALAQKRPAFLFSSSFCLSLRATSHPLLAFFTISTPFVLSSGDFK